MIHYSLLYPLAKVYAANTGRMQMIFQDVAVIKKRPHFGKGNKIKAKLFQESQFILIRGFVLINSTGGCDAVGNDEINSLFLVVGVLVM